MKKARDIASKAIIIYHNKYLLQLRDNYASISFPNSWGFFGGNLENGESPEQALIRELEEELGFTPKNYLIIFEYLFSEPDVLVKYFEIPIFNIDQFRILNEGQRMQWFTIEQLKFLNRAGDLEFAFCNKFFR